MQLVPEASRLPAGLKATQKTKLAWPRIVLVQVARTHGVQLRLMYGRHAHRHAHARKGKRWDECANRMTQAFRWLLNPVRQPPARRKGNRVFALT